MELQTLPAGVVETAGLHRVSTHTRMSIDTGQSGAGSSPGRPVELPVTPTHNRRSYLAVALLAVTTTFVFADQNLMARSPWCRLNAAAPSAARHLTRACPVPALGALRRRT